MTGASILEVRRLSTSFKVRRGGRNVEVHAVRDVSFTLARGEVLGIVGESGCGKTTLGRSIIRLAKPSGGEVMFDGESVYGARSGSLRAIRLKMRMVFQDPFASLNPRRAVGDSVAETGDIHGLFATREERGRRVAEVLDAVGLGASYAMRYPHELSGGQRQRVGIARAILPTPDLVVADEPVSALDVSVQAQVLNLLADLRETLSLSMIFISHDLGVVGQISDRVGVMYMGRLVELAPARALLTEPLHPYTRTLISAMPKLYPSSRVKAGIELGEPPSQFEQRSGCPYVKRCPLAQAICSQVDPALTVRAGERMVACHAV
jgi:peptide/nickel transport system ATP-binding protein/oligopeptide transport system ATP-binding protein